MGKLTFLEYGDVQSAPSVIRMVPVTITGTGHETDCYAMVNGVKYTSETSGIETPTGTIITLGLYAHSGYFIPATVTINGEVVYSVEAVDTVTYDWVVPTNVSGITIELDDSGYLSQLGIGTVAIITS